MPSSTQQFFSCYDSEQPAASHKSIYLTYVVSRLISQVGFSAGYKQIGALPVALIKRPHHQDFHVGNWMLNPKFFAIHM